MKGNLKNLNEVIGGSILLMANGDIGIVRFLMGEITKDGITYDICQARVCITMKDSERYATYRSDGISHQNHSYDIERVLVKGDGIEINMPDQARETLRANNA